MISSSRLFVGRVGVNSTRCVRLRSRSSILLEQQQQLQQQQQQQWPIFSYVTNTGTRNSTNTTRRRVFANGSSGATTSTKVMQQQRRLVNNIATKVAPTASTIVGDNYKDGYYKYWKENLAACNSLIAAASVFAAATAVATSGGGTQCERVYEQQDDNSGGEETEELPVYGSSSDPMFVEHINDDVILRSIPYTVDQKVFKDPSSDFNKSIRAFETSFDTMQDMLLATSPKNKYNDNDDDETEDDEINNDGPTANPKKMKLNPKVTTRKMYFYRTPRIQSRMAKKFVLLAGPGSQELGNDIAHLLGLSLNKMEVGKFADGESKFDIQDSVRGKHVYIVNTTTSTDSVIELMLLISALRRASAKHITAVIPYFGYSRQDRKVHREPIAAADVALMLQEMGIDQVMCMDLHSDTLRGFFPPKISVENLIPVPVAAAYFHEELCSMAAAETQQKEEGQEFLSMSEQEFSDNRKRERTNNRNNNEDADILKNYPKITVVAAHEGQVARAAQFRAVLQRLSGYDSEDDDMDDIDYDTTTNSLSFNRRGSSSASYKNKKKDAKKKKKKNIVELAVISKSRQRRDQKTYEPVIVGNVKGRKCILVDDIINTGNTVITNVKYLNALGAEKIYSWATHGVFAKRIYDENGNIVSTSTVDKLNALDELEYLLISNSVMYDSEEYKDTENNNTDSSSSSSSSFLPPKTKVRQLNVAPLLAEAIARALHDQSISSILSLENMEVPRYDDDGY